MLANIGHFDRRGWTMGSRREVKDVFESIAARKTYKAVIERHVGF